MKPPIVVLIAVAGKNAPIERTLASLSTCKKPETYQETIVVENGPKHDTEAVVKAFQKQLNTRYLYFEKGNKSAALNYAMNQIQNKDTLIFFTDDDARFDVNILMLYEEAAGKIEKGKYYYGGSMKVDYEHRPPDWLLSSLPTSSSNWPPHQDVITQKKRFLGINWAAYLEDLLEVGGFDPRFGPGTVPRRTGQEHNMQDRLHAAGLKPYYIPEAVVWHYVPKDKSSFAFALNRKFQTGIRKGILMKDEGRKPVHIWKYSIYMYLFSVAKLGLSALTFSKEKIMLHFSSLYSITGYIKGYFLKS